MSDEKLDKAPGGDGRQTSQNRSDPRDGGVQARSSSWTGRADTEGAPPRRFPQDSGRPWGGYGRGGMYFDNLNLPDAPLTPHQFYTRVRYTGKVPRILISPEAYKRMQLYVELSRLEVGWLGTAERLESGDFYIEHVFLLRQNAGAAHAKISVEGQTELYKQLMQAGRREDTRRLFFWGHSHVRMDTAPSPQDEETMRELGEQRNKWIIRGILNKLGRASFDVFIYEDNMVLLDVPWEIWSPQPDAAAEEPKTGLAAVSESLSGLKNKVVSGTKRLLESFSTDPVSKPDKQTKGPLHISAALRAEVEAEIRDKVTITYMPDFGRGYGELPLLQELAREHDAERSGGGNAAGDAESEVATDDAGEAAPGAEVAAAGSAAVPAPEVPVKGLPGPPESLPPATRGGAKPVGDSKTSNAPDAQGE